MGPPSKAPDPAAPRARAASVLGVILLVLVWSVCTVRLAKAVIYRLVPSRVMLDKGHRESKDWQQRSATFLSQLPRIAAQPGDLAFAIGPSSIFHDFAPNDFDARLREHGHVMTSYNFGFIGASPLSMLPLAHRIQEAFAKGHKTAALAIVEFPAIATTKATAKFRLNRLNEMRVTAIVEPIVLLRLLRRHPNDLIDLASVLALGQQEPDMPTVFRRLVYGLETTSPNIMLPETLENDLGEEIERINGGPVPKWNFAWRGEARRLFPSTAAMYAELKRIAHANRNFHKQRLIRANQATGMDFDEDLFAMFEEVVRVFQSCSRTVIVTVAPRDGRYIGLTPIGQQRLSAALDRIHRDLGPEIVDLSNEPFTDDDFLDTTHLAEGTGRPKYSRMLADRIAPYLPQAQR